MLAVGRAMRDIEAREQAALIAIGIGRDVTRTIAAR
jgi:hypothetical protein